MTVWAKIMYKITNKYACESTESWDRGPSSKKVRDALNLENLDFIDIFPIIVADSWQ